MKKLIATAAAAAMLFASAGPAMAQVTVAGDDNNAAQYVDCSQVQAAANVQFGDQNATANDEAIATAANELGITQNQANACFGEIDDLNQGNDFVGDILFW